MLTPESIQVLTDAAIIPAGTPAAQVALFAEICMRRRLDPFSKQVYLLSIGGKHITFAGIDGYRAIAARTGRHIGTSEVTFNDGMTAAQVLACGNKQPDTATVTVTAIVSGKEVRFSKTVIFAEFSKGSGNWNVMPFQMISKVVEAHALRMAFPDDLAGLAVTEEQAAFENTAEGVQVVDANEIDQLLQDCKTVKDIEKLYRSDTNRFKAFASLFAARKEQLKAE